jgi:3-hydroxyisobutyrate dehydrogenase-like beta-hydroxyacid dehydrogenase
MTVTDDPKTVAVIGLGNMGSALAEALLTNNHKVIVWNRTDSKCKELPVGGAVIAASVAEATAAADISIICVTDHQASINLLQTDEVANALLGKVLVQLSTVTSEESRELGRWADVNGIAYLDGSILAYPEGIRSHEGTIIYSGSRDTYDTSINILSSLGGDQQLVGTTVGGAPSFDKTIYAFHYASMLAFFHGAAICHAAGFPVETYVKQVASHGPETMLRFGEMIAKRSYDNPSCALEVEAAAYAHVVRLSEELGIDVAYPKMVSSYFERAIAAGHGQHDLAATFEILLKQNT